MQCYNLSLRRICEAPGGLAIDSPIFKKTSGALRLVTRNQELEVSPEEARQLLDAGELIIGVIEHAGGKGHAFFVLGLLAEQEEDGELVVTIEANTGPGPNVPTKDREGDGVYLRSDRAFDDVDFWLRVA